MREKIKDPARLNHMLMAIDNVAEFIAGKNEQDLFTDKLLFYAVVKNIEIIGEAANKLTKDLRSSYPEVDWEIIMGMRHVLVHDYYAINPHIAWITAVNNLPPLRCKIEQILESIED